MQTYAAEAALDVVKSICIVFQRLQADKWKTIEGKPISASLHHAVEAMVGQMNSGIATLPALQTQR